VQRGIELASRRAFFSARTEFIGALRCLAQALDAEGRTDVHGEHLAAGLRALEEVDEFVAKGGVLEAELNVPMIAGAHRTPVVRMNLEPTSPLAAQQMYLTYAQEMLSECIRGEPSGSQALSAMGKLYAAMEAERTPGVALAYGKALVLQQAALLADSQNAAAANELGVLLAKRGRHSEAKAWLQHSAALLPDAAAYHNLAVVCDALGDAQSADQARRQRQMLARGERFGPRVPDVRIVEPHVFVAAQSDIRAPASSGTPAPQAQPLR
jgi:tetratricopeptide (TPR) repeat protein